VFVRVVVTIAAVLILAGIVLAVGSATGRFGLYSLYTHCGIRYVDFGGTRFYANPPLGDGSGNPPAGWGNPSEGGFVVVTDPDHLTYFAFVHRASFATHPKSGVPTIEVCS
jgi:hypothetical protein